MIMRSRTIRFFHPPSQLAYHQAGGRFSAAGLDEPASAAAPPLPGVLSAAVAQVAVTSDSLASELLAAAKRLGVELSAASSR
jgi:hypothetical protein